MGLFRSIAISASGLTAERLRMDTIANNLANANTTRTPQGGPYRRQMPIFAERQPTGRVFGSLDAQPGGVRVVGVVQDEAPLRMVYDPSHPDADPDGMVAYPNVNPVTEMVDLITATRAYEANVTAINAAKDMVLKALEIGRA